MITVQDALKKLKDGNRKFLTAESGGGDISPALREKTSREGQHPYAIIVACSDSRVIPESIFSAGIGELFVIRVAGNVIDNHQLGSIEYAAQHLGCPLVVVLGHSKCGAVNAAISHSSGGYVKYITDEIKLAIGEEKDDIKACCLNVKRSVERIKNAAVSDDLQVVGAIYHLEDGRVEFFE